MHEKNTKTPQKFDCDEFFINWYKLLLCCPISIGIILGIVISLYISKGGTTNSEQGGTINSKQGIIGGAIGFCAGLATGALTLAVGLGICFFKNRNSSSQTESDDNQEAQNPIDTTIDLNPR